MADPGQIGSDLLAAASAGASARPDAEQVTQRREGDLLEARSTSRRIKTVEDLLAHIEADMSLWDVAASEATKWEVGASNGSGGVAVTELHRVWVRLKPKAGPSVRECVEAMISAASLSRAKQKPMKVKARHDHWAVIVIADCHFGKYCWGKTTGGGDYDLSLAESLVGDAARQLIATTEAYQPARRTILFLGDLFHYDTPHGSTTSGTPLERDGRMPKMIQQGCDTLLGVVECSAATRQTDVAIVNGNHDEALTFAFQRILQERFRNDRRVTIAPQVTSRQYLTHGNNLLGIAHGHRAKKRLPQIMALEAAEHWARCWYREYHTGHYHSQAAEWQRPIETIDSVIVRTAPAICPPDDWHAASGFIGSRQAMEAFVYRPEGGLSAIHIAGPTQ